MRGEDVGPTGRSDRAAAREWTCARHTRHKSVLVAHPERQHSHQLAAGLHAAGRLGLYIHGAPPPDYLGSAIPRDKSRYVHWTRPMRRLIRGVLPLRTATGAFNVLMRAFDARVAALLRNASWDAVVCYEMSALQTFRAAKQAGTMCILDAASLHCRAQQRFIPDSNNSHMIEMKEAEIELADLIITCSSLARASYVDAGVAADRVVFAPLGVELDIFRPPAETPVGAGPIRFCNAGHLTRLKGIDLLLSACRSLTAMRLPFTLNIAGSLSQGDAGLAKAIGAFASLRGRIAHEDVRTLFASADVFVMPSRFDSFGMVVTEALACGTPVIVSDHVGAKDFVEEGVNGWIVPAGDANALTERMAWCAAHPDEVRAMRSAARAAVRWDWTDYRREVAKLICDRLDAGAYGSYVKARNQTPLH